MAYSIKVKYFNSFWMKKVVPKAAGDTLPVGDPATVNIQYPAASDEFPLSVWPGLSWNPTGYPTFPWGGAQVNANPNEAIGDTRQWYIEEGRIRGGFNNTMVDLGVKAYVAEEEEAEQQHRFASLIYSGIYNSRTGINDTNVFSVGEEITKSVNPIAGSIQKLFAENTNLNIWQENKVSKALIDKDAIYSAEGNPVQTNSNVVIGQIVPYLGEYGISKNPESFATFGYQKYFADQNRGVICRLSRDGITEISEYGMRDYFRDALKVINNNASPITLTYELQDPLPGSTTIKELNTLELDAGDCGCCSIEPGMLLLIQNAAGDWVNTGLYVVDTRGESCQTTFSGFFSYLDYGLTSWPQYFKLQRYIEDYIVGGYDIHNRCYTVSLQPTTVQNGCVTDVGYSTLNFDENINGWVSFYDYKPVMMCSLKNDFYSSNGFNLWKHYANNATDTNRGVFYDQEYKPAQIRFIFNSNVSMVKSFQTINYEGSNGWEVTRYYSDPTEFDQDPFPITPPTNPLTFTPNWKSSEDATTEVASYEDGVYIGSDGITYRSGFYRKENRYVANLISASLPQAGEVIFWDGDPNLAAPTSGIKGYYVTVDMQTDDVTNVGGLKELFSVGSNFVMSSI